MGYSIEASGDSCYQGTSCLINKFDIRDDKKLSEIQAEITFAKAAILESEPPNFPLDFEYYKSINRFLFEDLYDFNFSNINPDLLMIATIKASGGTTDDLYQLFREQIKQIY